MPIEGNNNIQFIPRTRAEFQDMTGAQVYALLAFYDLPVDNRLTVNERKRQFADFLGMSY